MDEIAQERNLVRGTVEGHLMEFVPTGEVDISVFVTENELKELEKFMKKKPELSSSQIFSSFNEKYSHTQIIAVRLWLQSRSEEEKIAALE
ncbi:helix-turn-helix domain-containing protein [Arachidicoccus ginsenosidimutans]|uniref:helix-turn-helix domain-containing protein n=1 Tax=Arachidicoccus sp. BS20 TaxID=1850526 RepID=UPI0009EECDFA